MAESIYRGRGDAVPYNEYIPFINEVFGFDGKTQDFRTLLPKLYRPGRTPQKENYVVTEDGVCVAAVGAFSHEIQVCGTAVPCRGIGNVAVAKSARGRGYMKDCMHMALADMVRDGIALSTLGGRRQRYRYFGYEKAGTCFTFAVCADNLRHTMGADFAPELEIRQVSADDAELLSSIHRLSATDSYAPIRAEADFFDILSTWRATVWAATRKGQLIGYALRGTSGQISEIRVTEAAEFLPFLWALRQNWNTDMLSLCLPEHEDAYVRALAPVAEGYQIGCSMSYNVLNYRLVCDAFLRLKATYTDLADGGLKLLIHGLSGDEGLCLSVCNGVPSVTPLSANEGIDAELSHTEAMGLLFAPLFPDRCKLSPAVRSWLPLPIWMYRADEV